MKQILASTLVVVLLAGCLVGQRSSAPDADTDGLPDELELGGWNLVVTLTKFPCFGTEAPTPIQESRFVTSNELRTDSDGDGVSDFDEHFHGGDPNATDTDGDGLDDKEEWDLRSNEDFFAPTRLALNRVDSDEDCLSDAEEVRGFEIPGIGHRQTDPTTNDGDHDGFTDVWEIQRSKSDPTNPDTDGDGSGDRQDLDPLNDVSIRWKFTSLTAKDLPKSEERVELFWNIPTKNPSDGQGTSGAFQLREGETWTPTADQEPGEVDVDDERGGTTLILEIYGRILDAEGRPVGILDINPHLPGQAVQIRYDVSTDRWQFRTQTDYTEYGTSSTLETDQVRFTFLLEDFAASE